MQQTTNHVFLVQPVNFGFNDETAYSNVFQSKPEEKAPEIQHKAIKEFNIFVKTLIDNGIEVSIFKDTHTPIKPDAIFPNNWISLHADGTVVLYPMHAINRRHEVNLGFVEILRKNYRINQILDLRHYETKNIFLEGTGSIVFDHNHKIAYACISERTNKKLLIELCEYLKYKPIYFNATDRKGKAIYHTNVLMCIGNNFVTICMDAIEQNDKKILLNNFNNAGLKIIDINFSQLNSFCGNMLELKDQEGKAIIVLSQNAYNSLTILQKQELKTCGKLLPININTIETVAGGGARCMVAEIFL